MEDTTITDALTTLSKHIDARKYDEALSYWIPLRGKMDTFSYWYHLGTIQALRNNLPQARYAYEKARHSTFYSEQLEVQLDKVLRELKGKELSTGSSIMSVGVQSLTYLGPMKCWFLIIIFSLFILLSLRQLVGQFWKRIFITFAVAPIILMGWFYWNSSSFIVLQSFEVFEGPSRLFGTGVMMSPGERLMAWRTGDWMKLYTEDGSIRWAPVNEMHQRVGWLWGGHEK